VVQGKQTTEHSNVFMALDILLPIARALDFAQGRKVWHGDHKPDNVFLHQAEDGTISAHLGDWGVSRKFGDGQTFMLVPAQIGTVQYLSPELFTPKLGSLHKISFLGQSWSFGVLLLETLNSETITDDDAEMLCAQSLNVFCWCIDLVAYLA
jgi:serine/threonine protein kinase